MAEERDTPDYEIVEVLPQWMGRLRILAKEDGVDPIIYIERLIRRQWDARSTKPPGTC